MNLSLLKLETVSEILEAVHSKSAVSGVTHNFYRYPARFSNLFARTMIETFTKPGDLVLDPYMGGGTTIVEARLLGRRAIGIDISSLSNFITKVKTTPLSDNDIETLILWAKCLPEKMKITNPSARPYEWIENGYQRNISSTNTWPIRKIIELTIAHIDKLQRKRQRQFARCVLLNTGQWALDCRKEIPTAKEFRERFIYNLSEMIKGAKEFALNIRRADRLYKASGSFRSHCLNSSVIGIEKQVVIAKQPPRLILTSPPYPGVHILYHRWQVQGRKETPAPFWISNCLDGQGASFYTFGDRKQPNHDVYFDNLYEAFKSIVKIIDNETMIVQMLSFSDPSLQLPRYLEILKQAGLREIIFDNLCNAEDGRLWREVPNRKWYADRKGKLSSSKEVVLFHHLA
jgi:hypothetical protein